MDYLKIYDQLISSRKTNILKKCGDGSIESHHIIPHCISKNNNNENIVNLTCREHYIAHLLLVKIFKNTQFEYSMLSAVMKMQCKSKNHNRNFKFNSRLYENIRKEFAIKTKLFFQNMSDEKKLEISKKISFKTKGRIPGSANKILVSNEQLSSQCYIDKQQLNHYCHDLGYSKGMLNISKSNIGNGQRGYIAYHNKYTNKCIHIMSSDISSLTNDYVIGSGQTNDNPYQNDKIYITNIDTHENKTILKSESIPIGWKNGHSQKKFKYIWITNVNTHENKRILSTVEIPNGWKHGRYLDLTKLKFDHRKGTRGKVWVYNINTNEVAYVDKNKLSIYLYDGSSWRKGLSPMHRRHLSKNK